jgi:hypothetical protein
MRRLSLPATCSQSQLADLSMRTRLSRRGLVGMLLAHTDVDLQAVASALTKNVHRVG